MDTVVTETVDSRVRCYLSRPGSIDSVLALQDGFYCFCKDSTRAATLNVEFTWNPWVGDRCGRLVVSIPPTPGVALRGQDRVLIDSGDSFAITARLRLTDGSWTCICEPLASA
jgi:hypothetical protein